MSALRLAYSTVRTCSRRSNDRSRSNGRDVSASRDQCQEARSTAMQEEAGGRWRMLAVVGGGTLLAMAPWFSSAAVAPLLVAEWGLDRLGLPALTIAVQLGFAAGALGLAATAAADV